MQSRFAAVALGLLAMGGAAACQTYSMEGVDPQTVVAVETEQRFVGAKPPVLLIVQDRSGSMNLCFGEEPAGPGEGCGMVGQAPQPYRSRMDVAQSVMDEALRSHDEDAQYGLILYGVDGVQDGCGDASTVVAPSVESSGADQVRQEYASNPNIEEPQGGTPTTRALKLALDTLVDPATGSLKAEFADRAAYVVLVTDGLMNCNDQHPMPCICSQEIGCGGVPLGQEGTLAAPTLCLDKDASLLMVEALAKAQVSTFVIGLGETFQGESLAVQVLDALAMAGGRPRRDESGQPLAPAFYSAGDPQALQGAIAEILEAITAPCEYTLPGPVCEGRLIQVNLRIDGDEVVTTCGDEGDATWNFVDRDPTRIRFNGDLCSRMQRADEVFVEIKGIQGSCPDGQQGGAACDLSAVTPAP